MDIGSYFDNVIDFINSVLWGNSDWSPLWSVGLLGIVLIGAGIYFTVRLRFVQVRHFPHMFSVVKRSFKPDHAEGVSSFQAFATSLAARVGAGNIAGVALAITIGGPGAVFWMWVIAFIGMATAMIEATLAQVYKQHDLEDGNHVYRGGPAYYMLRGLNARRMGIVFSVLLIIAFPLVFNAVQANTVAVTLENAFGGEDGSSFVPPVVIGIALAAIVGVIILGGVKRIGKVAELVVPIMAIAYVGIGLLVVFLNITEVPSVLGDIVLSAFGKSEVAGGVAGFAVSQAIIQGIKRGLFSNEAGLGSAPNAAAAADVRHPASQGYIQSLGVFVDTIVVCTTTAIIILMAARTSGSGVWDGLPSSVYKDGAALTQNSLAAFVGEWGSWFIAIALVFFAFTSIVANYYYGETALMFFKADHRILIPLKLIVLGMVIWGATTVVATVWDMADAALGSMAIVNLAAILLLSGKAVAVIRHYNDNMEHGEEPEFLASDIPGLAEQLAPHVWTPADQAPDEADSPR